MADKAPERGTVFISYSHKDEVWKDRLVKHLAPLRQMGDLEIWEDRRIPAGGAWKEEIDRAIGRARVALLLVSPDWLASDWIQKVEAPQLLERAQRGGITIIPVILRPCAWLSVPWLSRLQAWPHQGKPLASLRGNARETSLADLARQILDLVGAASPEEASPAEPQVSISRLPASPPELIGREAELKALDDAWENPQVRIVSIVGLGGIGKTALVSHWLSRMARDRYRGADRVFGWSFEDQKESESFYEEALRWFGVKTVDPYDWKQAERLARLIREVRTLLILDGFDSLHRSETMKRFLYRLSSGHRGLVVLTYRVPPPDSPDFHHFLPLGWLSPEEGVALLRSVGAQGSEQELARIVGELEGHPLALTTLFKSGERKIEVVQRMLGNDEKTLSTAELGLLRLCSLFDRAASPKEIAALCSPPIPRLTDAPQLQNESLRSAILQKLAERGVLALERRGVPPDWARVHPLIREYLGQRLRMEQPEVFRQGHERLFRYLASQPQTVEEMTLLIESIAHGCAAGLWGEAVGLYRKGILNHLTSRLGAAEAEIKLLAPFFEQLWHRPRPELSKDLALLILQGAGSALLATGRPREAQDSFAALLERARSSTDWRSGAWAAQRLSEAQIFTGHLGQALITAQEAVEWSEKSKDEESQRTARTILADAHHQAGRLQEAWQIASQADLPSYRYLDLLLAVGRFRSVLKQVSNQRRLAERSGDHLHVALSHLALGRAQMEDEGASSRDHFDQAVDLLRRAGFRHWLTAGLLARAGLGLLRGTRLDEARRDLKEALDIATRCELRLYEADAHLAFTRLYLKTGELDRARQSLSRARSLIDETGYHRRDAELQELEAQLSSAAAESPLDPVTLAFRLVLAGHATPDLLLHPDPGKIEEAARRLSDEPGDPLLRAQRILEEQQPGVLPNPLWAAWVSVTYGQALQQLGRRGSA